MPVAPRNLTASVGSVNASSSSVTLFAANPARRGCGFHNNSSSAALVKYGSGAAGGSYTEPVAAGAMWQMSLYWNGLIHIIWTGASPSGAAQTTETSDA